MERKMDSPSPSLQDHIPPTELITEEDYCTPVRMTRNRKLLSEGKSIRKPNYVVRASSTPKIDRPRWYNQTYIMFLALRKAGKPVPRGVLIPMALELDKQISKQRGLPPLFGGKTPQNTASGILTENRDKLFVSFIPEGKKHVHFKLAYEPGNFKTTLETYNIWMDVLIKQDWPYLFSKRRKEYEVKLAAALKNMKADAADSSGVKRKREEVDQTCGSSSPKRVCIAKEEEEETTVKSEPEPSAEATIKSEPEPSSELFAPLPEDQDQKAAQIKHQVLSQTQAFRKAEHDDSLPKFEPDPEDDIPTRLEDVVEVKQSTIPNSGRGLFAKRFIPSLTELGFYFGLPMTEDEFDSLKLNVGVASRYAHHYRRTILDATDDSGYPYSDTPSHGVWCPFHYINENTDPKNANLLFLEGVEVNQVLCVIIKDVQAGEEIFVNYGKEVERDWSCNNCAATPPPERKETSMMQDNEPLMTPPHTNDSSRAESPAVVESGDLAGWPSPKEVDGK